MPPGTPMPAGHAGRPGPLSFPDELFPVHPSLHLKMNHCGSSFRVSSGTTDAGAKCWVPAGTAPSRAGKRT
jgi:hypothetical protein